tara:strand:- start:5 stop:343 length:339 start_codon:yes stop_codon:yes gene_type:complete
MKTTRFEPGEISRYIISEVPYGEDTVFILWMDISGRAIRVSGQPMHWMYVAEKMRLTDEDAKAVAFYINSKRADYEPDEEDLPLEMKGDPKSGEYTNVPIQPWPWDNEGRVR